MVAVEAKPLLEAEAKKNQVAAGKNFGKGIALSILGQSYDKPINSGKEVASQFDVSRGYVYDAQKIKNTDPVVADQVRSGAITIPEAKKLIALSSQGSIAQKRDSQSVRRGRCWIHLLPGRLAIRDRYGPPPDGGRSALGDSPRTRCFRATARTNR